MLKERTTQLRIMVKVSPGQQEIPVSLAGRKSKMRMASGIKHRWDKMISHSFSNNIVMITYVIEPGSYYASFKDRCCLRRHSRGDLC